MSEHPILFKGDMIRAILDGRKTQTRRIIKPQPVTEDEEFQEQPEIISDGTLYFSNLYLNIKCPYGKVGDKLWVRESFWVASGFYRTATSPLLQGRYAADESKFSCNTTNDEWALWDKRKHPYRKTSGRFMYKSLIRLWLEVTGVRVERVQDISEDDAKAEGLELVNLVAGGGWRGVKTGTIWSVAKWAFQELWDSINKKRGYDYETYWIPEKALKAGYYNIIFEPGDKPERWRYWPPHKDKLTGDYLGPCVGEDPEALTLDIAEPGKIKFIVNGKQIGMKKKKVRIRTKEQQGYGWDKNPWVWVVEFKKCEDQPK